MITPGVLNARINVQIMFLDTRCVLCPRYDFIFLFLGITLDDSVFDKADAVLDVSKIGTVWCNSR